MQKQKKKLKRERKKNTREALVLWFKLPALTPKASALTTVLRWEPGFSCLMKKRRQQYHDSSLSSTVRGLPQKVWKRLVKLFFYLVVQLVYCQIQSLQTDTSKTYKEIIWHQVLRTKNPTIKKLHQSSTIGTSAIAITAVLNRWGWRPNSMHVDITWDQTLG